MTGIGLRPDGPHHPEYTRQVAETIAEAVRVLNYATRTPSGLDYPATVYTVLGSLAHAAARMDQALAQLGRWLQAQATDGRAVEYSGGPHGGDTTAAMEGFMSALTGAQAAAGAVTAHLEQACNAICGMEARP